MNSHLLEEILNAPASELSPLYVKQTLIMYSLGKDVKEFYREAISVLNTLHPLAEEYNCLHLYLRLSLGLRIKELVHCLSLPVRKYQEIVGSFTSVHELLPEKQLKQIFSVEELAGFRMALSDVCYYFTSARDNEREIQKLKENVGGECFRKTLTNVAKLFFQTLQEKQPLPMLDQIVQGGELSHELYSSTEWDRLLVKHLSGLNSLDSDTVCQLLIDAQRLRRNTKAGTQGGNKSVLQIPASQSEDETVVGKRKCAFITPNIQKFMKAGNVKGCVVQVTRTDSNGQEIK